MKGLDDEQIVALYQRRDETAISRTREKYDSYLHAIAYNILGSAEDSEESVNDAYLAAWNTIPPNNPTSLAQYLGKLTRRISIDLFRKKRRKKRGSGEYVLTLEDLGGIVSSDDNPEQYAEAKQLGGAISEFLRRQPENERNAFIGRYFYMDPLPDVARYCGMSEARLKALLYRTRIKLKKYLEKEGYEL